MLSDADPSLAESQIPARVQAAQTYLLFTLRLREPSSYNMLSDLSLAGQELSAREQSTYDAALEVLLLYFRGEMDYGDAVPRRVSEGGDDAQPMAPVLA